jgi:hypothetical protein
MNNVACGTYFVLNGGSWMLDYLALKEVGWYQQKLVAHCVAGGGVTFGWRRSVDGCAAIGLFL